MKKKNPLKTFEMDPMDQFNKWYDRDRLQGVPKWIYRLQQLWRRLLGMFDPALTRMAENAFALTTVGEQGPDSRIVLLKKHDVRGFEFYTNYDSAKGKAIAKNPRVQMLFYYPYPLRQIRIWGTAEKMSRFDSEAYWDTRPRGSQISQTLSDQSEMLDPPDALTKKVDKFKRENVDKEIKCPENWGGYRIVPDRYEFWVGKQDRLHDRIVYEKYPHGWSRKLLQP